LLNNFCTKLKTGLSKYSLIFVFKSNLRDSCWRNHYYRWKISE